MPILLISACALASAGLAVRFAAKGPRRLYAVFKPLTMALVIAAGLAAKTPVPAVYKTFILAGLLCSLAGDVALLFPEKGFAAGLACFLAAHVFYILAFRPAPGHPASMGVLLPFIILGLLMFKILAPSLGRLKFPVFVYTAAITVMAWLAAGRYVEYGGTRPLLAFAGAVLLLLSDSALAYNRFAKKIPAAQVIILGTYFPAQLLIALSI
ncbi:MAG: lysoplasmalogenase [Acidobacteriota bacterium]